ncbi:pilin [Bacillus thuringiensis]|uniref:pilin n=1 Tax=Bacillus thuringiensis TaxID=1428 RepID=UPI0021D694AA|nr:pilin [Bacillus thuringiensis]MCU7666965.1 pilin [Bacillus thuringiensis]
MTKNRILSVLMFIALLVVGIGAQHADSTVFAANDNLPYGKSGPSDLQIKTKEDSAVGSLVSTMYTFGQTLAGLIFGVSVIVIVWAGFKYATSQGDAKTTEQAKMQIITAGIGIGVALLAMVIVKVFAEIYDVQGK